MSLSAPPRSRLAKRVLLGRPLASEQARHHLLPPSLALPVFASDALSSNAYATEEILHVLVAAGVAATTLALPIAGAVAALLAIVIVSYRQTVKAYPRGGGSYIVSRENLGTPAGLVAGASLQIDYVLTVAVSVSAGVFALVSLHPSLAPHRVVLALSAIGLITMMNLRGLRESGLMFAIPTYAFIVSVLALIGTGVARCAFDACPRLPASEPSHEGALVPVTAFLILRAFSSGATALTGVEAIADGVGAFRGRRPREQARGAAATLAALGVLSITIFLGLTLMARVTGALPDPSRSVVAQIAAATFGNGPGFWIVQATTALILVLAANTAFQDFPRLASILARDRFMPRQFINQGDRLVFSNGVLMLAGAAAGLVLALGADVSRLIQLYVVGVFTSFTLSQAGMVVRNRRLAEPGWKRRVIVSSIGAATTGTVLLVVAVTKFAGGAWIVICAIPVVVALFAAINAHYRTVAAMLRDPASAEPITGTDALVLVPRLDAPTLRAVATARAMRPSSVRALHVDDGSSEDIERRWPEIAGAVPLTIARPDRGGLLGAIRQEAAALGAGRDGKVVTVVIPEVVGERGARGLARKRRGLLLKAALLFEPGIVVTDVPSTSSGPAGPLAAPARVLAVVPVSGVHNATKRALDYARHLSPTDLRAITFNVDTGETARIMSDWGDLDTDTPLDVIDSPFREVTAPLIGALRALMRDTPGAVVNVILPEFIVAKWWHQALHNQTSLAIKAALLFEPGVVVTSVPFHLR